MDKNTITGLILIFTILITFSYLNSPSESQQLAAKHQQDSIAQVATANAQQSELKAKQLAVAPSATLISSSDTSKNAAGNELKSLYGVFSEAVKGTEHFITLENNLMKIKVSNKGGKIYSVELKGYKRFNGEPLVLFEGEKNRFGLNFFSQNKSIQTDQFYFVPSLKDSVLVFFQLFPNQGTCTNNCNRTLFKF